MLRGISKFVGRDVIILIIGTWNWCISKTDKANFESLYGYILCTRYCSM